MTNTYQYQKEKLDHHNDTWGILPMDLGIPGWIPDFGHGQPHVYDRLWPIHTKRRSMYGIYLPIYLHEFVS